MNNITRRRRAMMGEKEEPARLPAEYQEVEWIGTNGMATASAFPYISPGVKAINGDVITIWFKPISFSSECCVIGNNQSPQLETYYSNASTIKVYLMQKATLSVGTPYDTIVAYASERTNNTYKIGYWNTNYLANYRAFYLKHVRGGNTLLELIPCYRKADGVIGMYDLVSESFFANSGTGTFAKGGNVN